jgi:hypothetical protein
MAVHNIFCKTSCKTCLVLKYACGVNMLQAICEILSEIDRSSVHRSNTMYSDTNTHFANADKEMWAKFVSAKSIASLHQHHNNISLVRYRSIYVGIPTPQFTCAIFCC